MADVDFDLVRSALPDAAAGEDPDLTHQVTVLDVRQAKGLEFDAVVVVDPTASSANPRAAATTSTSR